MNLQPIHRAIIKPQRRGVPLGLIMTTSAILSLLQLNIVSPALIHNLASKYLTLQTGTGWAAHLLANAGAKVTGVNIAAGLIKGAKKGYSIYNAFELNM